MSLFTIYLVQLLLRLRKVARTVGHLPGPFFLFDPVSHIGYVIGRMAWSIPYIHLGNNWMLSRNYEDFAASGQDAITMLAALPRPECTLLLADAGAIKEVTTSHAKFPKPVSRYKSLTVFGPNIVASEGEGWKKYRKIAAPAFSEKNNKLVWDETTLIMMDLFDSVWGDKSEIVVDHCADITLPITLFVIGVAGFGRRVTWTSDLVVPPGHQMTFKDALHILSTNLVMKIILPDCMRNLTKHSRKVHQSFIELNVCYLFQRPT